jgi:hypothetical protein
MLFAGCGGDDGPCADEALSKLTAFDKAAVRSHNAVSPKFARTFNCMHDAGPARWGSCTGFAKAYLAALEREQRKLGNAYERAPDYVRRIYGDYYRVHRRANAADHTYANQVLEVTRSMKTLDIARAKGALPRMNRAADKSKGLDARARRLLAKARAEGEDYVRSL